MLKQLKELTLFDIKVNNLDFLRPLDDNLSLELCGIVLPEGYDISLLNEFRRFAYCDISEMIVGDVQSPFVIESERKG